MRFLTRSSLRSRKAQFFILSAFAIVTVMFFISQWIEPFTIPETASIVLIEEPFVFNNLVEKAMQTAVTSGDCESLNYNLDEFRNFAKDYSISKNTLLNFSYSISSCTVLPATVDIKMRMRSPNIITEKNFTCTWFAELPGNGRTPSQPAAAVHNNQIVVVVRGTDNGIYQNVYNGVSWSGWSSIGGLMLSQPGLVLSGSSLKLYVHGTDGKDYVNTRTGGSWSSFTATSDRWDPGPTFVSFDRFYNFITGDNGRIYYNAC